jgi:hypothetical protein
MRFPTLYDLADGRRLINSATERFYRTLMNELMTETAAFKGNASTSAKVHASISGKGALHTRISYC